MNEKKKDGGWPRICFAASEDVNNHCDRSGTFTPTTRTGNRNQGAGMENEMEAKVLLVDDERDFL
ncbi:MAG: hypothetical protein RBT36_11365, partial [Desulfobulbus sp.]|nr:hypothetical protein [Desulfobulbus sp.]